MDKTLNLAFSMHNNPGVYALLLGSGISKSAGIPTGWEIKQRLIAEYNQLCDDKLPEAIDYGELLENLGKTPAERNMVLRRFFEHDESSEEARIIEPSVAHRKIASLVKSGHIKVILTTNFDRLMELSKSGLMVLVCLSPTARISFSPPLLT